MAEALRAEFGASRALSEADRDAKRRLIMLMKKVLTLLSTVALGCALWAPAFARAKSAKAPKAQETSTAAPTKAKKAHTKRARKHGTKTGKKVGQQETTPGQNKQ
ncbi:MAG: hypothetical protein DMG27_07030 [Acidobacteria bacterium]|nr:MAG: hypothetical protein DMG27_07030 [Acidobacteriota bacterium]